VTAEPSNELRIAYGGQAVLEGVMMRGRRSLAIVVRHPLGQIALRTLALDPRRLSQRVRRVPVVRGAVGVWEMLVIGMKALNFSASVQLAGAEGPAANGSDGSDAAERGTSGFVTGSVLLGLVLGVGLFFVLPLFLTSYTDTAITSDVLSNIVEGLIRLALFLAYLWLIGLLPDIRRVWMYHGAEHKTINALEAGEQLTVAKVQRHSLAHPRCGTGFLVLLVLLSIVVFALAGRPPMVWRVLSRVALVPLIAGVGFELMMFLARHRRRWPARLALQPGLVVQRLTTRQPTDDQVEVAIVAMDRVLALENQLVELRPVAVPATVVADDRPA